MSCLKQSRSKTCVGERGSWRVWPHENVALCWAKGFRVASRQSSLACESKCAFECNCQGNTGPSSCQVERIPNERIASLDHQRRQASIHTIEATAIPTWGQVADNTLGCDGSPAPDLLQLVHRAPGPLAAIAASERTSAIPKHLIPVGFPRRSRDGMDGSLAQTA